MYPPAAAGPQTPMCPSVDHRPQMSTWPLQVWPCSSEYIGNPNWACFWFLFVLSCFSGLPVFSFLQSVTNDLELLLVPPPSWSCDPTDPGQDGCHGDRLWSPAFALSSSSAPSVSFWSFFKVLCRGPWLKWHLHCPLFKPFHLSTDFERYVSKPFFDLCFQHLPFFF